MAKNSKIEWTDHSWNPWLGCSKVSPACTNCYAERDFDHRYKKVKWGPSGTRVVTGDANWKRPLAWNKVAAAEQQIDLGVADLIKQHGRTDLAEDEAMLRNSRPRVFCASLADVFESWDGPMLDSRGAELYVHDCEPYPEPNRYVPWPSSGVSSMTQQERENLDNGMYRKLTMDDVRRRLFDLIDKTPNLDWLVLTKRPENIGRMLPIAQNGRDPSDDLYMMRDNLWLGTSIENQEWADKRLPFLLAAKRAGYCSKVFVSAEPLVGPIDLTAFLPIPAENGAHGHLPGIDWVITGGESGPDARPCDPEWFRSLRDQCDTYKTPFHFKQWGEFDEHQVRVGKKKAGRLLDGRTHESVPEAGEVV